MSILTGGCLCGDVRYSIADVPVRQLICHCRNCQRQSGSAFSPILAVPFEALTVFGDAHIYLDRGESGGSVDRHFCGRCGSPLLTVTQSWPNMRYVKAGTLDDTSVIAPKVHVWCASAWPSTHIPDGATIFPRGVTQTA